jgi:RecA/RadA recombinase
MGLDVGEETDEDDIDFKKGVQRFGRTTVVRGLSAEEVAAMIKEDLSLGELTPNIIIIDSVAVLNPEQVMKKDNEDLSMNDNYALAKFLTEFLKSVTGGWYWPPAGNHGKDKLSSSAKKICLADTNTTIININHAKQKTESANGKTWTVWEHVGGKALDFHCCLQFMVTRVGFVEDALKNVSHQKIKVCADKNKVAPPKRECMLLLDFKGGISQLGTIDWLSIAINKGMAEKSGGWITSHILLEDGKIQGGENFNKYIDAHDDKKKLLTD